MIYTKLTNLAIQFAYEAHKNQTDISNNPYILHPIHLAEQMNTELRTCVALLHDVVEDTAVNIDDLRKKFPEDIVDCVDLLTHKPNEEYIDYVQKICTNLDAMFVKLADLIHNLDETRLDTIPVSEDKKNRWVIKYTSALCMVSKEIEKNINITNNNSLFNDDRELYEKLIMQYKTLNRKVLIPYNDFQVGLISDNERIALSGTIEHQLENIIVETETILVKDNKISYVKEKKRQVSLKDYEYNQFLLTLNNMIIGIIRIDNSNNLYKKNCVSYILLNQTVEIKDACFIDNNQSQLCVNHEITNLRMFINTD